MTHTHTHTSLWLAWKHDVTALAKRFHVLLQRIHCSNTLFFSTTDSRFRLLEGKRQKEGWRRRRSEEGGMKEGWRGESASCWCKFPVEIRSWSYFPQSCWALKPLLRSPPVHERVCGVCVYVGRGVWCVCVCVCIPGASLHFPQQLAKCSRKLSLYFSQ